MKDDEFGVHAIIIQYIFDRYSMILKFLCEQDKNIS